MTIYHPVQLNAHKLKRCYDVAPAEVQLFLEAEISVVLNKIQKTEPLGAKMDLKL